MCARRRVSHYYQRTGIEIISVLESYSQRSGFIFSPGGEFYCQRQFRDKLYQFLESGHLVSRSLRYYILTRAAAWNIVLWIYFNIGCSGWNSFKQLWLLTPLYLTQYLRLGTICTSSFGQPLLITHITFATCFKLDLL